MKKIFLWVVLGLLAILVVYSVVNISYYSSKRKAKYEATRSFEQTAYAMESQEETKQALTPTIAPESDLGLACRKGDGTTVEIASSIESGVFVQTIPSQNVNSPDHFSANSFYIRQGDFAANLSNLSVCGKDFFSDCVYMFNLSTGEAKFDPEDLKGYAQKGEMFRYGEVVVISGVIDHWEGDSGNEGCLIMVDKIRVEN